MASYLSFSRVFHICCAVCCLALVSVTPVFGGTVQALVGNLGSSPFFNGSQDVWFVPGAPLTNGTVMDGSGPPLGLWTISSATFAWTGNPLDQDLSYQVGSNWLADATFLDGGTVTITGTVYNVFNMPLYSGLLFEGLVSGFRWTESAATSNSLDLFHLNGGEKAIVQVTGGWLATNGMGMAMPLGSLYWLDASALGCQQDGRDMHDWQGTIYTASSFTGFSLVYYVPEPGALILLLAGGFVVLSRRR
ncbi:MAG: PEP-CTERM sorting domain-containing protein [Phycisphaerales bacterium]|nr:PEP-CTERM sorting domain-containing protein [Phycisphaerales bacterium]